MLLMSFRNHQLLTTHQWHTATCHWLRLVQYNVSQRYQMDITVTSSVAALQCCLHNHIPILGAQEPSVGHKTTPASTHIHTQVRKYLDFTTPRNALHKSPDIEAHDSALHSMTNTALHYSSLPFMATQTHARRHRDVFESEHQKSKIETLGRLTRTY